MNQSVHLESELKKALAGNEFRLFYQPKVNLSTGKIEGMEALIRWEHPEKGLIPPAEFIPIAEESGLIIPMGEWVLRNACLQTKEWIESGFSPLVMSVNLSVRQLYQPNLVEAVEQILKETQLAPEYLELEITESMMVDKNLVIEVIKELRTLGVQMSLDDFGTGYSSLHYLNEFQIDSIKIDQSFIRNCTSNSYNSSIVKMIIEMAHRLNLKIVAEGVETKEELIFLQKNSCNQGQGYLFSRPLPAEEISKRILEIEEIVSQKGIFQQLHNKRMMEEALESSRQELRDIMHQQQGMIFKVIKENDRFIHTLCDGQLMYRMGQNPEQVIGKELKDFLPPNLAKEKTKYYQMAWEETENVTYEAEHNGIHYFASLSSVKNNGQVTGIIGSCVDITEQKRIELALKEKNFIYQIITDHMLDLIGMLDINGKVVYASPSHEKLLGFPASHFLGDSVLPLIHPEDIPALHEQFLSIRKLKTSRQLMMRYKHANGGWVDIEAKVSPVFNEDGEIKYFIAVGRKRSIEK
ncbi:EAL domain-containing protein [Lysinibacillus yapensis]|nr:EAL domain-containing protein [Lysinibacillus yapensis]